MADPIDRAAAYEVLSDYYHHRTEFQHMALRDALSRVPSAQPEIIRCRDCRHNGSFDTDCPIDWNGKEYCSFAERRTDG